MRELASARRVRGLVVVAVAAMLFVGPVPASGAELTKWDTIGAGWAYGGSSRLLEKPNNGIDGNGAQVSFETITALDPRRIRLVVAADEVDVASSIGWDVECIDRRGNRWSSSVWRNAPALPLKPTIFNAGAEGRVQACIVRVSAYGDWEDRPYQLRVKVQARYARS